MLASSPQPQPFSGLAASLGAFLVGSAMFWGYFHRFETHMFPLTILNTFLASYAALAIALINYYDYTIPQSAGLTSAVAASFLVGAFGNCLFFRLFLNPLNRFPGPWQAKVSNMWWSFQLGNSDGYFWLEKMHKKYGKFLRVGSNDLSIIDPDIMDLAYGSKSRVTKAIWYDNDYPLTSMHTSRDKGLHDRRRRVWAPAFSEKALRDYETEIQKFNAKLIQQIRDHNGKPVNCTKWFNLFSFDAMGLLAFGRDYGMLDKGEKPHELEMLDEGMQPLAYRLPSWFFRILVKIPFAGEGYNKFVQFCIKELTWRVKHAEEKKRDSDIMGWLLKAYKDVPHPENDTMLQADARLIIVAGSDTTAATFTFLFYYLAKYPEQVKKLRAELEPIVGSRADGNWQESDIRGCKHLEGAINEALRLHPPVPSGLNRLTPPEGLKIGDTWVPGNVTFFNPQYVMAREESIYAQASEFIPERWYSQKEMVKHDAAFAPFSAGPFGCIGKNLALMELRTLTTRLIMNFDLKLAPGEDGTRLLTKTKDHFTVDLGDLEVTFTPRS